MPHLLFMTVEKDVAITRGGGREKKSVLLITGD